jgi:hypothetical protein
MTAPIPIGAADLPQLYDRASEADRRRLETHVLVSLLQRAAEYAISSEFHPDYSARASGDVPAVLLRLWQEICRFVADPTNSAMSDITMLMRQILNTKEQEMQVTARSLAIRRAAQLANATDRELRVMERHKKNGDG